MNQKSRKEQRSRNMAAVKGKGNKTTEIALVKLFRLCELKGWKRHQSKLIGKPDFFFPKKDLVIFVDGCFWHGCSRCKSIPKTNKLFWKKKIDRNILRDRKVTRELKKQGMTVKRIWEHDLKKKPELILRKLNLT